MTEEATIRRGVRNARYTTVPNHVFEDQRLSMEARWLLGYLLSKPDNWTVRMGDIRKKGGCGRDKARAMVSELVEAGYMEREDARKDGKFNGLMLVIYDEPQGDKQPGPAPEPESVASLPQTCLPAPVEPATANPPLVKTEDLAIPDSSEERERGREGGQGETRTGAARPEAGEAASGAPKRGSASEGQQEPPAGPPPDDPKKFEARVKRLGEGWPGWANSSTGWAVKQFAGLTDAERAEAERWGRAYLAHCGGKALSLGTYFAERKWIDLPERLKTPEAGPVTLPPFGKAWGAALVRALLTEPPRPAPPAASAFLVAQLADPGAAGRLARLERQAKFGWPSVNRMLDAASQARGLTVTAAEAAALDRLGQATEQVWTGTDLWAAWEAAFAARGWPFLRAMGRQRVASFPKGGPAGLDEFRMRIEDARTDDDGADRQAAE